MEVSLSELSEVKGIGKKTIDRIKDELLKDEIPEGEFDKSRVLKMNNLYLGNSIELLNGLPDDVVDMIATDPPYPTTSRGNAGNSGGMLQKDINKKGQVFENNDIHIREWIYQLYRVLKPSGHCYIMTNHKNLQSYLNECSNAGFKFIKSLIWNKGNKIMGQFYMSQYEYILFFRKGRGVKINNCGTSDILKVDNVKRKREDGSNYHDTEKPVELMEILIKNSSDKGELVLDPFAGTGSTLVAAQNLNRNYIGMEIDPVYYEDAKNRLEKTGL